MKKINPYKKILKAKRVFERKGYSTIFYVNKPESPRGELFDFGKVGYLLIVDRPMAG